MICPYCRKEMEKGYIQSRDGLGWNHKKRFVQAFSGILPDQGLGVDVVAYRCTSCKKIVIDYACIEEVKEV